MDISVAVKPPLFFFPFSTIASPDVCCILSLKAQWLMSSEPEDNHHSFMFYKKENNKNTPTQI